jgi:uncharacterized protein (DUF1778 family)
MRIHECIFSPMSKSHAASSKDLGTATNAVAEHSSARGIKESINFRIDTNTRKLIDDAAAILDKTRTEFMIKCARQQAIDVMLDQRLFLLDLDRYDAFMRVLDNPPAPGAKRRALLRLVPAWGK